jgi:uncharacterized protein YjbI with pentapeptide repeats
MKPIKPKLPKGLTVTPNANELLSEDTTIESVCISKQSLVGIENNALSVKDSKFEQVRVLNAELKNASLLDVHFDKSDFSSVKLASLSAHRTVFSHCRLSGLQIYESNLKDVTFLDCKLDLSNFRFSKLERVEFVDCVLSEADFSNCKFSSVVFTRCDLVKADFSLATIKSLDLRSSNIAGLNGLLKLNGATISNTQLITIAPNLAAEIGLLVKLD